MFASEDEATYLTIQAIGKKVQSALIEILGVQLEQEDRDLQEFRKNYTKLRTAKTTFTENQT